MAEDAMTALGGTWQLLLGMLILMLGAGLQGTETSLRATLAGFPAPVTGALMSCYYLGYMVGTAVTPRLVRSVGHIRVFAMMSAIASATILIQGLIVRPLPWALLRAVSGLCLAGVYVVAESWLNDRASRANRGSLLAIYLSFVYGGVGGSQFLLNVADPLTATPFMLVALLISLAIVPIVIAAQQAPEIALPRKVRYRDLYRNSPLGVVTVTISGMVSSNIFSMGPVYARLIGLDTSGVASFMAVSILSAVVTQYPLGRWSDRVDRRTIIAGVCILATLSAATLAWFRNLPHGLFLALTAVFSGLALTLYSLAASHVNDQLEPSQMVAASGALRRLNGIGAAVSPVLIGGLIASVGPPAYFGALAVLMALLTCFDLWRKFGAGRRHTDRKARSLPRTHRSRRGEKSRS